MVHNILELFFGVCRIYNDIPSFIPNVDNLCLLFLFVSIAWGLSILLLFLKNTWVHWFFSVFLLSVLSILLYCLLFPSFCWLSAYFALLILGSWDESLDYWFEPWFWLYAFSALNSLLNTTLAISCKCRYVVFSFLLCTMCFLNFLWDFFDSLFTSVWFCLQVYEDGYLSVIDFEFGFIADGKYIISILLNSLRFTLLIIWPILAYVLWMLEKNVYSIIGGLLYKCQLNSIGWCYCWILLYLC